MTKSIGMICCAVLLLLCTDAHAQRIKNENAKVAFNRLPDSPLPEDFNTYSASVRTEYDALSKAGLTPAGLVKKYFNLRAFKQLPTGGHFHVNATVGEFAVESAEIITKETTTEDKEGNKKKVKQYYRQVVYRMPVTMTIEDKDGNVLEQKLYGSPAEGNKHSFFKKGNVKFNSVTELNEAWKGGQATYNKLRKSSLEKAFTEFSAMIKNKYDTKAASTTIQLKVPAGKKVPGAEDFKMQAEKAATILKTIKAGQDLGSAASDLQPMLTFWDEQKNKFSPADKKEKKVHHACLYNIAAVNLYIGNFAEAKTAAEAAVATEEKKQVTKYLLENVGKYAAKAEAQNAPGMQFPIDLSAAVGPEGADYSHLRKVKERPEKVDRSVRYDGYYITTRGDSLRGTYVIRDGRDRTPVFYSGGNTKFHYEQNGETIQLYVSPEKFKRGGFNGRRFTVIQRKPMMSIKNHAYAAEVIESGSKMRLMRIFPMERKKDGATIDDQTLLKVVGEDGYENIGDVTIPKYINWRKGFASLFEDCEVLYAEIRVGEYPRDLKSIADAIRVYNTGDCE